MWKRLHNFLEPPIFEGDDEKTRHAELLHYSSVIIFTFSLVLFWLNWVVGTDAEKSLTWILGALALLQFPILWMIRTGYVNLVSVLLLTGSWGIMTAFGRTSAGIHDVAIMGYVVNFIGSAILLGWHLNTMNGSSVSSISWMQTAMAQASDWPLSSASSNFTEAGSGSRVRREMELRFISLCQVGSPRVRL